MKRLFFGLVLLLVVAAAIVAERRGYSDQEHVKFHPALDELKRLDAIFNEDVLRARFSMLENYDEFERDLVEMERLSARLHDAPRFVSDAGRAEIARSAGGLDKLFRERRALFEEFKSSNAVVANSRRYFPLAVNELTHRLDDTPATHELRSIVQDLTNAVLSSATRTDAVTDATLGEPDRLEAWAVQHSWHGETSSAATVARHARQLLRGKNELDALTRRLLMLPAGAGLEHISNVYERELSVALQRTNSYRTLLIGAGALLALAVVYAFWSQREANRHLEARVVERTQRLQNEVAERARVEAALQDSKGFLQSLLETLPVFIFRKDREGRLTFVNDRFCNRLGRSREDLIGKTALDLLSVDEAGEQATLDQRIMTSGDIHDAVERMRNPITGATEWAHLIKVPLFDLSGACIGVQGMFLDVTKAKRAEDKLVETSALLEAMLANSPDHIYFKDRDSRFVRFSKAVLHTLRLTDESQLVGRTDLDIFGPEHAQPAFEDEQKIIRTGVPIVDKLEKETYLDGRVTWALTTKMPWRDATGAIVGIFGISKDVTALKEIENKLAHERDQLRALLDSSPDKIYFKDLQSRFVLVSRSKVQKALEQVPDLRERRAARGLSPDVPEAELLNGLSDFDTFQDDTAQILMADEQEIIRRGEPIIGKIEKHVFLDGTTRWSLSSKMPWRSPDGRIVGTFGISKDVTAQKEAEAKIEQMHRELMDASRQAGMAEVATGVLHNVGNVLNSVNVSATLVTEQVRRTKALNIVKLAALCEQHKGNLGDFITHDPRGQMIPAYLHTLADSVAGEQQALNAELENLRKNVEHIKDIVAMQQAYARTSGVMEAISVPDMVEDALRINSGSLARHEVDTVRDYQVRPVIVTDKHKVMQILINLVRNAKYACDESGRNDKLVTVKISRDDHAVKIAVVDNGVGIPPENLTRIFAHGFTTRKEGHGFGLHSGALAARELGGELNVHSEGPGLGATFTLSLPNKPDGTHHE